MSQSRWLYNFAQGYALTGESVYLDAVEAGSRFLLDHFWDGKFGGWFRACAPTGEIVDDVKDCYGHAFVLFGLAHASATTRSSRCREALQETWTVLTDRFRDGQGGYQYFMSRDFRVVDPQRSQNPMMHLFEALLAAGDLPGMSELHGEAVTLADLVLNRLRRPEDFVLPEVYDADWKPLPVEQEGRIDIGHAFEWAFLMSEASARGLSDTYAAEAAHFLAYGMRLGYDREEGGIFSPAAPDGVLLHPSQRLVGIEEYNGTDHRHRDVPQAAESVGTIHCSSFVKGPGYILKGRQENHHGRALAPHVDNHKRPFH